MIIRPKTSSRIAQITMGSGEEPVVANFVVIGTAPTPFCTVDAVELGPNLTVVVVPVPVPAIVLVVVVEATVVVVDVVGVVGAGVVGVVGAGVVGVVGAGVVGVVGAGVVGVVGAGVVGVTTMGAARLQVKPAGESLESATTAIRSDQKPTVAPAVVHAMPIL